MPFHSAVFSLNPRLVAENATGSCFCLSKHWTSVWICGMKHKLIILAFNADRKIFTAYLISGIFSSHKATSLQDFDVSGIN